MRPQPIFPIERNGSRITGNGRTWQMMSVEGPLAPTQVVPAFDTTDGRQYFWIETSSHETLLVYRRPGERGMRRLFLVSEETWVD